MDKAYVSYEYAELPRNHKELHFLLDCYESLGWETDTRLQKDRHLTLRRSRRRANYMELSRLQSHLETCLRQMEELENRKDAKATSAALTSGILGTILMALSVFAVTAQPERVPLCILFGVPAMALWAYTPVAYRRMRAKTSAAADDLIRQKQQEIFEICEKGSSLL